MHRSFWIIASAVCFGTGLTVSRLGLAAFSPLVYTGLRLLVALGAFAVLSLVRRRVPPRDARLWIPALCLGITGTALPMLSIVSALQMVSSGVAAIIATCGPAFAVVFAHIALPDEKLNVRKALGIAVAVAGAASLALQRETGLGTSSGQGNLLGYGLLALALAASHASLVLTRKYLRNYALSDVVRIQILAATAVLAPFVVTGLDLERVHDPAMAWFSVLFGGIVGTFLAFSSRFHVLRTFGATDAAAIDYVVPIVASAGGVIIADETVTLPMLAGVCAIFAGVALLQGRSPKKPQKVFEETFVSTFEEPNS
ncbi:DMT family transporter [Pendulispora brunnea]|uniref:DMT family transporter n=1 Tax=Pendulispora brunnea TaxID=2905690 RepID=A0ABZ2KHN5_9BACT